VFYSLPVSVKNSHPLGYWLTPILVDCISKQTGEKGVFCYGKLGLRTPSLEDEVRFNSNLDFLGINCERTTDEILQSSLLDKALRVCGSDRISPRVRECFVCPCGILSMPTSIVRYLKQKTFKVAGENVSCKLCGQVARVAVIQALVYTPKSEVTFRPFGVYPRLYIKEVNELVAQIHEQGITISRTRPTGYSFGDWNLDIEFLWSFLPLVLAEDRSDRIRAVITNQVLRQAVTTYLLCRELEPSFEADLVISPLIVHPGRAEKWNLDRLRSLGYDGDLIRTTLLGSLGWGKKEATLNDVVKSVEHRRFNLFRHVIGQAEHKVFGLSEAIQNLSHQNLVKGLSNVFNPERFDYSTLKGVF
jgi:hypothetical protein